MNSLVDLSGCLHNSLVKDLNRDDIFFIGESLY